MESGSLTKQHLRGIRLESYYMEKIVTNKIRCKKCGDVIESIHRHDFKFCKCRKVAVDGGRDYLRRVGNSDDFVDMTLFEVVED